MKKNLHYLLITVVLLLVLINTGTVKVMSTDIDFSTGSFSKEDEDRIIRNICLPLRRHRRLLYNGHGHKRRMVGGVG